MIYINPSKLCFYIVFLIVASSNVNGQYKDLNFFGLYQNDWKLLNPALTSNDGGQHFNFHRYSSLSSFYRGKLNSNSLSYDNYNIQNKLGVGFIFNNFKYYSQNQYNVDIAAKYLVFRRKEHRVFAGVGLKHSNSSLQFDEYIDQDSIVYERETSSSMSYLSYRLGLAYQFKKILVGGSLNMTKQFEFYPQESSNSILEFNAQAQYQVHFGKVTFTPAICYGQSGNYHYADIMLGFEGDDWFIRGINLRKTENFLYLRPYIGAHIKQNIKIVTMLNIEGGFNGNNTIETNLTWRIP